MESHRIGQKVFAEARLNTHHRKENVHMDELTKTAGGSLAVLDGYARQGQRLLMSAAQNLIEFGHVLEDAKPLVPKGQWESWVRESFGMSERTAQQYMAVWKRFGGKTQFEGVQFSSLSRMLALPEGKEEAFLESHDLEVMTAREVEKAVKEAKDQARLEALKAAQEAAQTARRETAREYQEKLKDLEETKAALSRISMEQAQQRQDSRERERLLRDKEAAETALREAREEARDLEEALQSQQAEYDRLQGELLDAKSSLARGDAEREVSESLSLTEFCQAVRSFLGTTAQVPYMGGSFAQMVEAGELRQWREMIDAVADWAKRAEKALDTIEEV